MIIHGRLLDLLEYDPSTGYFKWKSNPLRGGPPLKNKIAGSIYKTGKYQDKQYRYIKIDQRRYRAGRLAWFYIHGVFPTNTIDHINRNTLDDRIENLRDVDVTEQNKNRKDAQQWRKPTKTKAGLVLDAE
jgi:hypothetical protein